MKKEMTASEAGLVMSGYYRRQGFAWVTFHNGQTTSKYLVPDDLYKMIQRRMKAGFMKTSIRGCFLSTPEDQMKLINWLIPQIDEIPF